MARPIQIIPSVLPADWANMGAECKRLEDAGVDRIQFDVMDGNFVPNLTCAAPPRDCEAALSLSALRRPRRFGPLLIAACQGELAVLDGCAPRPSKATAHAAAKAGHLPRRCDA